ncbi:MAG: type II toxin-antitoxin system RelE/ParE family toxin [Nitrospiria bacterium]
MSPNPYKFRVTDDITRFIRSMHPELRRKIKAALKIVSSTPEVGKTLRDDLAGLRSFLVSRFRIIYRISGRTIEIIAVGPRERIYEETYRLIKKEVR